MIVLVQLSNCGSGGVITLVIIGGTSSEKCREMNVDTRLDFPTPSVVLISYDTDARMMRHVSADKHC